MADLLIPAALAVAALLIGHRLYHRLLLSLAKHPSLTGHARMSRRVARLVPYYSFDEHELFACDGAPASVAEQRRQAFFALAERMQGNSPGARAMAQSIETAVSDVQFTSNYRVPFQFAEVVRKHLRPGLFVEESAGVRVRDPDGNWAYDLAGSYGVNVFGYDFYKECMAAAEARTATLGPVLGNYHPVVAENVASLRAISGLDEVSFHMSGTEAVMQAVRLARYHTGRSQLVTFCGAYHGWWDGVQPGVGNSRRTRDVFILKEMDAMTLRVLDTRRDIACVLVNPVQVMHPNRAAPGDSMLISNGRRAGVDRAAYQHWLAELRQVCDRRGIVLIFDEVFVGFRLARGGAQEYFGVRADMVTWGKTLGGGLPVGVLCGRADLMKRFRQHRPADVCFARGTFNAHPLVMAAMNEFLRRLDSPAVQAGYQALDATWDGRARALNEALAAEGLPLRVVNLASIWTLLYSQPSRFNWMFQYYLRANGLALSWIGTGRLIFSHNYTDADFSAVQERFLAAARQMQADGWWWADAGLSDRRIKLQIVSEIIRRGCFDGRANGAAPALQDLT